MQQSLARVILTAPDETVVHCGHGGSTTIGRERVANPFLQDLAGLGEPAPPTRGL
jgi:glyoxylase-like metal-dependent hydrolase (beta-lactamase superfamily II)